MDTNPLSRLPRSEFKNLQGVRKAVEKHVDQIWGLDEQPPEIKQEIRPAHSIPRVALIGPKRITKTYEERMEEIKEQKQKDQQRIQRIREGYLKEMKDQKAKILEETTPDEIPSVLNNDIISNKKFLYCFRI